MLDHGPRPSRSREKKEKEIHRATRPRSYAIDKVWEAVTSRCLGNGRSDTSYKQYGGVSAWYKQFSVSASYKQYVSDECTYNIQSRQKHNMLSLLHAACLKLLVFFLFVCPKFWEPLSLPVDRYNRGSLWLTASNCACYSFTEEIVLSQFRTVGFRHHLVSTNTFFYS